MASDRPPGPRYAGFWPRLGAALVDSLALIPLTAMSNLAFASSRNTALLFEIPLTLAFALYNIYFIARCGQTPGKMALGIKVASLDGTPVTLRQAWLRHVVDLALSLLMSVATMHALLSISSADYDALSHAARVNLTSEAAPVWADTVTTLGFLWTLSELFVLLTNEKRRAIHDFIAGTVVVHVQENPVAA
jgi:uncharacterized RDD family membrane protein YckC